MKHFALIVSFITLALVTVASASPSEVGSPPEASAPVAGPAAEVAVLSGRWKLFFGNRICWGQVVNLPGESQCV